MYGEEVWGDILNKIYNENCMKTLDRADVKYDYVFCVPPDFEELGLDPGKDKHKYLDFLIGVFGSFEPRKNVVTIAITDRKYKGGIIDKHRNIIDIMGCLGYKYISQKIWCKSFKQNLYRLNYSFVMSFTKGKCRQNHYTEFEKDLWQAVVYKHMGYNYAIALDVVNNCVANFTNKDDVVYDPFMGSGTTAMSCIWLDRKYIGSEISKEYCKIAADRVKRSNDLDAIGMKKIITDI